MRNYFARTCAAGCPQGQTYVEGQASAPVLIQLTNLPKVGREGSLITGGARHIIRRSDKCSLGLGRSTCKLAAPPAPQAQQVYTSRGMLS